MTYISTFYTINNKPSKLLKYNLALCILTTTRWLYLSYSLNNLYYTIITH